MNTITKQCYFHVLTLNPNQAGETNKLIRIYGVTKDAFLAVWHSFYLKIFLLAYIFAYHASRDADLFAIIQPFLGQILWVYIILR